MHETESETAPIARALAMHDEVRSELMRLRDETIVAWVVGGAGVRATARRMGVTPGYVSRVSRGLQGDTSAAADLATELE